MKATLKHVANQYILIVDERPRHGEWWYYVNSGQRYPITRAIEGYGKHSEWWRIIAAENLDGVKGIALNVDDTLITDKILIHDLLNEVSFEEVEVTEEEDYWVVKL